MDLLPFTAICILYFFLHSFLADEKVKQRIARFFPGEEKYHRVIYNVISSAGLAVIAYHILFSESGFLFAVPVWLRWVAVAGLIFGAVLLFFSFRNYDPAEFLGTDRLNPPAVDFRTEPRLKMSGLNAYVRHPIYLSVFLLLVSAMAVYPTRHMWAFCVTALVYLPIGIWLEERKLIRFFGEAYREYRKKVPAIFPFLKFYR